MEKLADIHKRLSPHLSSLAARPGCLLLHEYMMRMFGYLALLKELLSLLLHHHLPPFPSLSTNRLLLRQIQLDDAAMLFAMFSDEEVMRFTGQDPHRTVRETRHYIEQTQKQYVRGQIIRWGITLKDQESVLLGLCSLQNFSSGHYCAETAYALNRAFWGKGLMTEAMTAILTYGLSELGLHRIEATTLPANEASKNLLRTLGFRQEGILRQRHFSQSRFDDEHSFGLLKDEWHG